MNGELHSLNSKMAQTLQIARKALQLARAVHTKHQQEMDELRARVKKLEAKPK